MSDRPAPVLANIGSGTAVPAGSYYGQAKYDETQYVLVGAAEENPMDPKRCAVTDDDGIQCKGFKTKATDMCNGHNRAAAKANG